MLVKETLDERVARLRQERIDELNRQNRTVDFGGEQSPARYDYGEFKEALKLLLSYCLSESGKVNIYEDMRLAIGNSSRLPAQLTNKLTVENAFFRLKPHLRLVVLERFVRHKRFKQIERDLSYHRATLERHLEDAIWAMYQIICND